MGVNLSKVNFTYYVPKVKQTINFTLQDISLNIETKDEFIALVGHTGSGKSTLVQLLNALLFPTSGTIIIDNEKQRFVIKKEIPDNLKEKKKRKLMASTYRPKFKLKPIRQMIGLVFQFPEYQIFEETVFKDISFGPKNFNYKNEDVAKRVHEVAAIMGVSDLLDKSPFTLSGGQMRKVAIAGILASDPDILILDEPTVGLDPLAKKELLEFLSKLNQELHKTIIIITHDMDVVSEYIKRVLVLKEGHLLYDGLKEDLFKNHQLIEQCHLDYPVIMKILQGLNEKLSLDLDIYQYNINSAYQEIARKVGISDEQ